MDERELWILNTVVEFWVPFPALAHPERQLAFNLPGPDFTVDELADTLDRLLQCGDLIAQREEGMIPTGTPFIPTRQQIEEALADRLPLLYKLTAQGGNRWEAITQPRWMDFVGAWESYDPDEGEVAAADRRLVEQYLHAWPYIGGDDAIVAGSETWEVLQPWQATYWKTLPVGHRVQFQIRRGASEKRPQPGWVWDLLWKVNHWRWPASKRDELERSRTRQREMALQVGRIQE